MPKCQINDLELHYETAGSGSPLLMVAGLASDGQSWAPCVPLLETSHHLIMPDNRTVGQTRPSNVETSIPLMAVDCMALIDALQIERVSVLGHSMGGMVAMEIAAHWPQRIDNLVVAAAGPEISARRASLVDTLVALGECGTPDELWFRSFFYWLFKPSFFDDEDAVATAVQLASSYPHRQPIEGMRRQADAIAGYNPGNIGEKITVPTLAILGGKDLMFPPDEAEAALQSIAGVTIEHMPEAAHSLHWDNPDQFCAIVQEFLSK